jgi:hypothetical protein
MTKVSSGCKQSFRGEMARPPQPRYQLSHDAIGVIADDIQLRCRLFPCVDQSSAKVRVK